MDEDFEIDVDGLDLDGDDDDAYEISGPDGVDGWLDQALGAPNRRVMLRRLASARIPRGSQLNRRMAGVVSRIAKISRGLYDASGKLEAEYIKRPNTLCSVYTPNVASGATSAFSVQPGTGNSFYRLLGFIASDEQANVFGFSSLRVGGQEHVNFTQSTPAAPVTSAVPWAIFALKEPTLQTNIAPWVGQVFDANTPITGTIVNMTTAGAGDTVTLAARGVFLTQTDPCGFRYPQMAQQAAAFWNRIRRNAVGLAASFRVR